MKIVIRKNVFETNSSSMHSVSYSPSIYSDIIDFEKARKSISNSNGYIYSQCGGYGWGYEVLYGFDEKLSYVLTSIRYYDDNVSDDDFDTINDSKYFKWLQEIIKETLNLTLEPISEAYDRYYQLGYIDHQSTHILRDCFILDESEFKIKIIQLLVDDNYQIIIDNDNH